MNLETATWLSTHQGDTTDQAHSVQSHAERGESGLSLVDAPALAVLAVIGLAALMLCMYAVLFVRDLIAIHKETNRREVK